MNRRFSVLQNVLPARTLFRLFVVWAVVALAAAFGKDLLGPMISPLVASLGFAVLLFTIIGAAFGVVREADELAAKLGEPYGTLILTLSIVAIEVILIVAVMIGPGETPTIGKDSIFSVMMIIMNLIIGLCLLLGGWKFGEQEYNAQGTMTYLGMIILLGGIGLMLPNFIEGDGGGRFTDTQATVMSSLIIFLYGFFLLQQMKGYRHLYVQPEEGAMEIPHRERMFASRTGISQPTQTNGTAGEGEDKDNTRNENSELWLRSILLIAMILPIVLLSGQLAVVVDYGIAAAGLPVQLGGVMIAVIVFTPESITAVKAALNNEFQRAVNLCHGAFVSTVGLTVPSVLIAGLITGKDVLFGMTGTETLLFMITLLLSVMTFLGKRTTPIVGMMHLALFAVFILLIFNP